MSNLKIIIRSVWIEYFRRKDFYVVLILTGLFALGALSADIIGIESASEAQFLMSFGLTMAHFLSGVVTLMLASRQLPREFESHTIYPLLARPVSRSTLLAGKILGVAAIGIFTLLLLTMLVWLPTPKSDEQSIITLAQNLGLQAMSLILLAILTCAVSLHTPPVVAMLLAISLFLFGGPLLKGLQYGLRDVPHLFRSPLERIIALVPDFSLFEHIARYVDGRSPMDMLMLSPILSYGLILAGLYFTLAAWSLGRRAL